MTATTGSDHAQHPAPPGYHDHKADHLARLHRVEGQVRGITRMVDEDRYCIDVLTQISAVTHALHEVALGLLDDHVRHCVLDAAQTEPAAADTKLDEITVALRRALRL
ncbi:metal-sensitive transcriptional regulator [Streptomyces phaeochromogenes]|uniref:metal-sensitive transcriptional regulator n=1 Tax=Streptomyces phaeochromogenes TaxID=1923 RepID=UPI002E2AEEB0|nr:metal-sensitive transcriptional regulator [Streptomyces phaeochromogenes]